MAVRLEEVDQAEYHNSLLQVHWRQGGGDIRGGRVFEAVAQRQCLLLLSRSGHGCLQE